MQTSMRELKIKITVWPTNMKANCNFYSQLNIIRKHCCRKNSCLIYNTIMHDKKI